MRDTAAIRTAWQLTRSSTSTVPAVHNPHPCASMQRSSCRRPPRISAQTPHTVRSILEVGCGSGYVVCSLALVLRSLGLRAQLLATDHSVHAVEATQHTLAGHQVGTVLRGQRKNR